MEVPSVTRSVHGCGTAVGRCMDFVDAMNVTQQVTSKVGLLSFFRNLVEGIRSLTSFFSKEGFYNFIQYHPILAQLQIISVSTTLHNQTRREPESLSPECHDSCVF